MGKTDLTDFQRGQIVGLRLAEASVTKTANLLGFSRGTVSKITSSYIHDGKTSSQKCRSGRKSKLTDEDRHTLETIYKRQPKCTAAELTAELNKCLTTPVSVVTVRREVQKSKFRSRGSNSKTLQSKGKAVKRKLPTAESSKSKEDAAASTSSDAPINRSSASASAAPKPGTLLSSCPTPVLVVQREVMKRNCDDMIATCSFLGLQLRAQTKTHKTIEGARLQTGGTLRGLVCSTAVECEFYAAAGADDILLGHPLTPFHIPQITSLTSDLKQFHVLVDNLAISQRLVDSPPPEGKTWSVYLKVDCGKGRAGVWHEDIAAGIQIVRLLASCPRIMFQGVYVHCGDTYNAHNKQHVELIRDTNIFSLLKFCESVEKSTGVSCRARGIGSTPSCRNPTPNMAQLTELHPGNYAFLDIQQYLLGSCPLDDIAVSVATRVIGHYPRRNQMLIDCGFTALTKQGWGQMATGYGFIKGHFNLMLSGMDQEHGFIEPLEKGQKLDYSQYPVGMMLFILPYHSCATAAMHPHYAVVEGPVAESSVIKEVWTPARGW